eukprot:CAMPEP_0204086724 /NCGR_PEP_ID=MMETSP0360-20130528/183492_1 /ASSEMBLY_ACC=CAM_ASM_000342 /TAXON_ID=268821 /ORGANISM="Scrippsiella Hangoei, Strain SHTV-5" /LENGTH=67 /DNA_ID=CAMNT_0051035833 /DNA_START=73 /DNA_END=273 /DNA_ORIENTATION=+
MTPCALAANLVVVAPTEGIECLGPVAPELAAIVWPAGVAAWCVMNWRGCAVIAPTVGDVLPVLATTT